MPVQGWGHSHYWAGTTEVILPSTEAGAAYPMWQASVITPSLFGGLQAGWEAGSEQVKSWAYWLARLWRLPPDTRLHLGALADRLEALGPEKRIAIEQAIEAIEQDGYEAAVKAVGDVAVTPGMRERHVWVNISRKIHEWPGWSENMYRHLDAADRAKRSIREAGSTISNPDLNLMVELAYHALTRPQ